MSAAPKHIGFVSTRFSGTDGVTNELDFDNLPQIDEQQTVAFKESIGLNAGDIMILQPTRIVQRKGIEHAIANLMNS